jgi:RimJ/RimL family protein N-acetyltransferase
MKKFTDLDALVADTAQRKHRAAQARTADIASEAEAPRSVYREGCATIAAALVPEGFTFVRSWPKARRVVGDFKHSVSFQSSHNNVRGEHVALWIFATVSCERLRDWRKASGEGSSDMLAGGQIGNLESVPGWREWDLADAAQRSATLDDALRTIRTVAFPFFAQFEDASTTLAGLREVDLAGLDPVSAIQFALAYDAPEIARAVVQRFIRVRSDLRAQYQEHLAGYRKAGVPPYWNMGYAKDIAKAAVLYGLDSSA